MSKYCVGYQANHPLDSDTAQEVVDACNHTEMHESTKICKKCNACLCECKSEWISDAQCTQCGHYQE